MHEAPSVQVQMIDLWLDSLICVSEVVGAVPVALRSSLKDSHDLCGGRHAGAWQAQGHAGGRAGHDVQEDEALRHICLWTQTGVRGLGVGGWVYCGQCQ